MCPPSRAGRVLEAPRGGRIWCSVPVDDRRADAYRRYDSFPVQRVAEDLAEPDTTSHGLTAPTPGDAETRHAAGPARRHQALQPLAELPDAAPGVVQDRLDGYYAGTWGDSRSARLRSTSLGAMPAVVRRWV